MSISDSPLTESYVDSSYSRTYLTASNNHFLQVISTTDDPAILAERRRKNELLAQRRFPARSSGLPPVLKSIRPCDTHDKSIADTFHASTASKQGQPARDMATALSEEQINALPLSSDEEDVHEDKGKATPIVKKSTAVKRPAPQENSSDNRRSKRHRKDDEAPSVKGKENEEKNKSAPVKDDMLDFLSQPSQTRKSRGYAGSSQRSFTTPSFSLDTPRKPMKHSDIQIQTSSPIAPPTVQAPGFSPPPASSGERTAPSLILHRESDEGNEDEIEPSLNDTTFSHQRRGSTSSLSSVNSLPDYQLDAASKKRLMNEASESSLPSGLPQGHFKCTICGKSSSLAGLDLPFLPKPKNNKQQIPSVDLAKLSYPKLRTLCRAHCVRDAQSSWIRHNYPTINSDVWKTFPSRVSKHFPHLSSVLNRKKSSYYLKHLDDALTSARGSQKAINTFFNVTALMLIRHGYYGPKGAKLVAQTLLSNKPLQKTLDKEMKSDKSMRTAGIGRLVDNVLVPEVLMRIVGEDMGVQDEEARTILDKSSDTGNILWGDDDEVEDDNE